MRLHSVHSAWIASDGAAQTSGKASSLFPWWSFTKTVIAICVLRLVEQQVLKLDEPRPNKPYTLRQLLQHRAGVPDYGKLKSYHQAVARHDPPWSRKHLLEKVAADRLDFPPGEGWAYSNVGYLFVRKAIEEATGLGLAAALQQYVFSPLFLPSARLAKRPADFEELHWPSARTYDPGWVYHGCIIGTPVEAAMLLHALIHGRVLRSETLDEMLARHEIGGEIPGRPWTTCGYGLGLMSGLMSDAGHAIGHSGGGPFCVNAVYHFPDLPNPATVATFAGGVDEGIAEKDALNIALHMPG